MLVLVGNETISAQPPVYYFSGQTNLPCGSNGCEIKIGYNITATDFSQTSCGMWKLSATWYVIDDPCNKLISVQNFQWKNVTASGIGADLYGETVHGQTVDYHLPYQATFQMQFIFSTTTSCIAGNETSTQSYSFQLTQSANCGWCQSRFCVNTFTCADPITNPEQEWRMDMIQTLSLWDGSNQKYLYNNLGFQFSYAAYITWPCNNYLNKPTVIDMAADLNNWLKNNGGGYSVIKYLDAGDPNFNQCKIQFKLRSPEYTLRNIQGYSALLKNCSFSGLICNQIGVQAHVDSSHCFSNLRVESGNLCHFQFNKTQDELNALNDVNDVSSFDILILPNIITDRLKLKILSQNNSTYNILLHGINGEEYLLINSADPEIVYDLFIEDLKPGMYFLHVQDQQNGLIKVERFIKQ